MYHSRKSTWRPVSLTNLYLSVIIVLSLLLIALLQSLLFQAQRNNGLLFADDIHALPIGQTFAYLYLPTIVFVVYGFLWSWVDLDIRRLEPWYQLSKDEGATGAVSLLLDYPVQFILAVPLNASRNGHWTVLLTSLGTLVALWGLIPVQAGIFNVQTVNRTLEMPFARAVGYTPVSQQPMTFSAEAMQSVASILWLNESLRDFMTRDYVLAPFFPINNSGSSGPLESWTHNTERYGLDLSCEAPTIYTVNQTMYMNSSWGCSFFVPAPRPDRVTIDKSTTIFDTQYIGYYNADGRAQYWLEKDQSCPSSQSNTFIVQWSKSLVNGTEYSMMNWGERLAHANITTRWCRPTYYVQDVLATVSAARGHAVQSIVELGSKRSLPPDLLNTTLFELAMSIDDNFAGPRNNFPTTSWPSQKSFIAGTAFNLNNVPPMAPYAMGALQRPLDDYLDPAILDASYEAAMRLVFSRWLFDILSRKIDAHTTTQGQQHMTTQAVTMTPAFTYAAEGMLALIAILTALIMHQTGRRACKLKADPASLSVMMRLSAHDEALLKLLTPLDTASPKELSKALSASRFVLVEDDRDQIGCCLALSSLQSQLNTAKSSASVSKGLFRGVRPWELTLRFAMSFVAAQVAMLIAAVLLFDSSGQIIPPRNFLPDRILESYIPVALGTLIEPLWLVLYRQLCALQPFEVLRGGSATASGSLDLTYSAAPPQVAWWRTMMNGHLLLALVGTMPLLANFLSVGLSGLLFQDLVLVGSPIQYDLTHRLQFQPINGSALPVFSNGVVGQVPETWYIATSNLTTATPMPPWTDDRFSYLPFSLSDPSKNVNRTYQAQTIAFGSDLKCQPADARSSLVLNSSELHLTTNNLMSTTGSLNLTLTMDDGTIADCVASSDGRLSIPALVSNYTGTSALELSFPLDSATSNRPSAAMTFCRKHITAGWVRSEGQQLITPTADGYNNLTFGIDSWNATLLTCRVDLVYGLVDLTVDYQGYVVKAEKYQSATRSIETLFPNGSSSADLLAQMHYYIIDVSQQWHADAYPSDFMNYLMETQWNDSSALNSRLPVPDAAKTIPRYEALYNKLFAIFVSRIRDRLLIPNNATTSKSIDAAFPDGPLIGQVFDYQTRIFVKFEFFMMVVVILSLYILAAITLYARRPWHILARLPDTPASIIAYFAASRAVRQRRVAAKGLTRMVSEKKQNLSALVREASTDLSSSDHDTQVRYGFGSFLDESGATRIGIEEEPFVRLLTKKRFGAPTGHVKYEKKASGLRRLFKRQDFVVPQWNRESYFRMAQRSDSEGSDAGANDRDRC